jgi:hypothetical protein
MTSVPPPAQPFVAAGVDGDEAAAKSIRKLLWALWGIGWIIVPTMLAARRGTEAYVPLIMFSWLALNLIVGWHKGALIRMALQAFRKELGQGRTGWTWNAHRAAMEQVRVGVPVEAQRVRVDARDPRQAPIVGGTQISSVAQLRAQR